MTEHYEIKWFPPGTFSNVLKNYEEHDKSCSSIPDLWLACKGGFTDMWTIYECDGCNVTFYIEGLKEVELPEECKYYCDCCYRALAKIVFGNKD